MSGSVLRQVLSIKSAFREPIWLAATVSAALHVGAIAWMVSPAPSPRDAKVAGGQVIIEVSMVEGPEWHPGADTGEDRDRPATASTPSRAAARPDHHRAADRATDQETDHAVDEAAVTSREAPPLVPRPAEAPTPDAPANTSAVALLQAPPPPPAKPSPPRRITAAPAQRALSQTETADGRDARSAPAGDGAKTPTEDAAHRGGTKGAAPRGDNPKPEYPFVARKRGYQGRVVLRVEVLPNGIADNVELASSSGYDSLDAAAVRAVRRWRFVPARRNGRPVAANVTVPVLFKLY